MKKIIILLSSAILLFFLFFPRNVEHAVVLNKDLNYTYLYVNGSVKKLKTSHEFENMSVINFKYNVFKSYGFKKLTPIKERVMSKNNHIYDLEFLGTKKVCKNAQYYSINNNNELKPAAESNIIVGKDNISCFQDKNKNLKTFLIYPIDYSTIRVGISSTDFSSIYHNVLQLVAAEPLKLSCPKDKLTYNLKTGDKITFLAENNKLKISSSEISLSTNNRIYLNGSNIKITNISRGYPYFSPCYNGTLEINTCKNGLLLINETNLEDYLKKVIPSEMPSTGGLESLKCQAVAARTYAISDMLNSRFCNLGFHVDDSARSQVFNNIPSTPLTDKAVDSTQGLIMTYDNKPIDAKFYSTSCGIGTKYEDIWFKPKEKGESKPYLCINNYLENNELIPNSEDQWLNFFKTKVPALESNYPYYRWHIQFNSDTLEKILSSSLKNIFDNNRDNIIIKRRRRTLNKFVPLKGLKNIEVVTRSEGGNVITLCIKFKKYSVFVTGDSCVKKALRCTLESKNIVPIILSNGKSVNMSVLPSSFFSVEKTNNTFNIYGGAYGHGVGMSQNGAIELSKQGKDFKTILNYYYKNTCHSIIHVK